MSQIGVGLVGLSAHAGWAALAHLPALRSLPDSFTVTALAASSIDNAREAAEKFAVPHAAASPEELAIHPDVDLVVVAVKVPEHRRLVEAAIAAGKAVLCEWPLAVDDDEAALLQRQAAEAGVRTFVGLQGRWSAAARRLRGLIGEGAIGRIMASNILAAVGSPWDGVTDSRRTYLNSDASGATMLTIPVGHCLDTMSSVLGDFASLKAKLVRRRGETLVKDIGETIATDVADQIMLAGALENGAAASLHYRGGLSAAGNFRWEINGEDGDLVIEGGDGHLQYGLVNVRSSLAGSPLAPVAAVDEDAALPAHARSIASQYRAIHADMRGGLGLVPDFAHAVRLHRVIAGIRQSARES